MPVIFSWESIQILNKKTRSFINVRDTLHSIAVPGVFLNVRDTLHSIAVPGVFLNFRREVMRVQNIYIGKY